MARQRPNSNLATLLGQAATLIILSASGSCLECYWCGPLAEQVHRSPRAPPCEPGAANVTICEPGYTHCAVVASSPPFVESRYCVKFYQDECYTLYCSTTKTYRTTCPCRGELCNGPNTQREIDAFAALANTVAKTHNNRIKKRNAISKSLVHSKQRRNLVENEPQDEEGNLIDNEPKNDTANDAMQADQPPAGDNEPANQSIAIVTETIEGEAATSEGQDTDAKANVAQEVEPKPEAPAEESTVHEEQTVPEESTVHEEPTVHEESTVHEEPAEITKPIDNADTEENKEMAKDNEIEPTVVVTTTKQAEITTAALSEATMKPTEAAKSDVSNEIKPSLELPTAEALQQSASQMTTDKAMDPSIAATDTTTTHISTLVDKQTTPKPKNSTKNSSVTFSISFLVILTSVIANFLFIMH